MLIRAPIQRAIINTINLASPLSKFCEAPSVYWFCNFYAGQQIICVRTTIPGLLCFV